MKTGVKSLSGKDITWGAVALAVLVVVVYKSAVDKKEPAATSGLLEGI